MHHAHAHTRSPPRHRPPVGVCRRSSSRLTPSAAPTSESCSSPAGRATRRACTSSGQAACCCRRRWRRVPGVTVQVYDGGWPAKEVDGERVDDNAALDNADAVLIFSDGGRGNPAIQGEPREGARCARRPSGAGLGFAHYAVEVPAGVPGESDAALDRRLLRNELLGQPDVEAGVRQIPERIRSRAASGRLPPTTSGTSACAGRADAAPKAKITPILVVDAER